MSSKKLGTILNERYRLDEEIAQGGMGTVYRAHDQSLQRDIAVKILSNKSLGAEATARLMHEAQIIAKLNHPNIVTIHDVGEASVGPFIVMEFVEGKNLHDEPPGGFVEIVSTSIQICKALDKAHSNGVIHRDLKPENVMIDVDGTPNLMDFGLARSVASRLSSEGTIAGTVYYMAPEQAVGKEVDARTDLYALGVMLYELVTGRLPFISDDPVGVISQHVNATPLPPSTRNPAVPVQLEAIIMRLLAKNPVDRYSSARELQSLLENVLSELSDDQAVQTHTSVDISKRSEGIALLDRMMRGRLVGRKDEFAELRALWDRASNSQGHMVLISGEPGVGKTRLAKELIIYAQLQRALILEGRFHPELGVPYLGFWEALRDYLRALPVEDAREKIGSTAPELIKLIPEIREFMGEVEPNPAMGDVEAERLRLFDHITQFMLGLASNKPILFLLDDLHWADKPSLLLLHFILRNIANAPILVVGTYRETELDPVRPFYETLVGLNRERLYSRIILRRLSKEGIVELIRSLLDCAVDEKLEADIAAETDGNPFFIEEVVRSLLEKDTLKLEAGCYVPVAETELEVPQSLQVALGRRLAGLSENCQLALSQASVLGREVDFDVLRVMGEWEEDLLLDIVDEAVRAQLIVEANTAQEADYVFLHALMVQVLYESINHRRRARFHQKAGEALEKVYANKANEYVEQLAHHFSLSHAQDADKALLYNIQAADKAVIVYAHDQALRHYSVALEIAQDIGDKEQEASIWETMGNTHLTEFNTEEAISAFESAQTVLVDNGFGESDHYYRLCCKLGQLIAKEGNDPIRARGYLESALAHMPEDFQEIERVKCTAALATCFVQEQAVPRAIEQAHQALELAEDYGQATGVAVACDALCKIHRAEGDVASYMETAERQIMALNKSGDLYDQFLAYFNITNANLLVGRYKEAEEWALEGLEISHKFNAPGWESLILANYFGVLSAQGRWNEGLSYGERVLPLFNRVGCSTCFCYIFTYMEEIEARRGHDEISREYNNNAVSVLLQLNTPDSPMAALRWRFFGHVYLEEWEDAWKLIEEMQAQEYPLIGSIGSLFRMSTMVPEVAFRVGRIEDAESLAQDALKVSQRPFLPVINAASHFSLGLVNSSKELWGEAIKEHTVALNAFQTLGHKWDAANTQFEMGKVFLKRNESGDKETARQYIQDSLAAFQDLEANVSINKAARELEKF